MNYLLGLDAGTTSLKTVLYSEAGQLMASSVGEYHLITPTVDTVEIDAEEYWRACVQGIREVLSSSGVAPAAVKGLAISSQGESFVPVDENGCPLRPTIVWLDNRAVQESQDIAEHFGVSRVFQVTGQPQVVPTWTAPKCLWLRRHQPDIFRRTHKILMVEDYLIHRLAGLYATERAVVSSTIYLDLVKGDWWLEMLDFVGLSPDKLPSLYYSGQVVGPLTAQAAAETGLTTSTVVATGAMDQVAGAISAGNIAPGIVTETTGTAMALTVTLERPLCDERYNIPCHYHVWKDGYMLMAWAESAGLALHWFRDAFCQEEQWVAQSTGTDAYDFLGEAAARVPLGCEGLVALPHLTGAACPEFDPAARGVFLGISLKHTKGHFVRAIMEAVAFMVRRNIDTIEALGVEVKEITSLGGAAKSPLWNQIKADVLAKPILALQSEMGAAAGAAMLAGLAVGCFEDLAQGYERLAVPGQRFDPNPAHEALYRRQYELYKRLYENTKDLFTMAGQEG
jgi:sugar (pentulose or hexulose) kinase